MSSVRVKARQRGDAFKSRLLESLDWLMPEPVADQLGCSLAELSEQIEAGDLIAAEHDERVFVPPCQLAGGKLLPHLSDTLHAMSLESSWIRLSWLIEPNERLAGKSPISMLEQDPEAVIAAAR